MAGMSGHYKISTAILKAVDNFPVGEVLEVMLTISARLAANIREAGLASDRALVLGFNEAVHDALSPVKERAPVIRLREEGGMLQ